MAADATESEELSHDGPRIRVVECRLGTERYAIDVSNVDRIVEATGVRRIPRTPDAIAGIVDLRGEITAVIDPRELFSVGDSVDPARAQRILVFDLPDEPQTVGMLVDAVVQVESYPERNVDRSTELSDPDPRALDHELLSAVIRDPNQDESQIIALIDAPAAVDHAAVERELSDRIDW